MMCSIGIKVVLIWAMLIYIQARSIRGYYDFDKYERKSEHGGLSLRNYPYKAVDFLIESGIEAKIFNDFNSGAYLIGRTSPKIKVFIDGRTELYGGDFFEDYNKAWRGDTELFDALVQKFDLTGAFLNSVYVPAPEETIRHLYESPDWALVYFDYDAAFFLRTVDKNKEWIKQFKIDLSKRSVEKADLLKIRGVRVTPYRYTNRAQALYHLKMYDQAREEAEEALSLSAIEPIAYKIIGKVALKDKLYSKAMQALRHAKILKPNDFETRFYLAKAYYYLEEFDLAQSELNRVLKANPDNPLGLLLSSNIYQKLGQEQQAMSILEKVKALAPDKIEQLKEDVK